MRSFVGEDGKVISFEPQTPIYNMLCGGIALNNFLNVEAHNVGVGLSNDDLYLPQIDYSSNYNFGGIELLSDPTPVPVKQITLDGFIHDKVDFIKIDVEGMELEVH